MEISDENPGISDLTVKRSDGTTVSSNMIWRQNSKIYMLDDPDTVYQFIYQEEVSVEPAVLTNAIFSPEPGGEINEYNPTITISYDVSVTVIYADFYETDNPSNGLDISNDLVTTDYKIFTYTPPSDLVSGSYTLDIFVEDDDNNDVSDRVVYSFTSYSIGEGGFPFIFLIMFGGIFGVAVLLYFIMKKRHITFDNFIYIKNRKIIPFFKPIVFGPLHIDVDDEKVSKAEFYVNGDLKETITESPYIWKWNEKAFMKHTIEAKVYDQEGKSTSSGEMTFLMFNPNRPFR